jgi:hypothetical protein
MYIRMRVLPWSNTLLCGQVRSIQPFGEPVVLLSAIERSGKMEEGKIATAWPIQNESINAIRVRVLPWSTLCSRLDQFNLCEPVVLLVQLNVRENGRR